MQENLKSKIQEYLPDKIKDISLKGSGSVNNAYFVETQDGSKYTIKIEKEIKDFQPQNTLNVEARVAQKLSTLRLPIPTPEVIFISNNPEMYCYKYIEGEPLINLWSNLSDEEKIEICKTLGYFHAEIGQKISREDAENIGVLINEFEGLHPEVLNDYNLIIQDHSLPEEIISLAKKKQKIFLIKLLIKQFFSFYTMTLSTKIF